MLWQCPVALGIQQSLLDDFKILVSYRNDLLGTLDFTGLEHWAPFDFSQSTVSLFAHYIRFLHVDL